MVILMSYPIMILVEDAKRLWKNLRDTCEEEKRRGVGRQGRQRKSGNTRKSCLSWTPPQILEGGGQAHRPLMMLLNPSFLHYSCRICRSFTLLQV